MAESAKPNIFNYATSELSQDAFICWLLEYSKNEHKNTDEKLHECGKALLEALVNCFYKKQKEDCFNIYKYKSDAEDEKEEQKSIKTEDPIDKIEIVDKYEDGKGIYRQWNKLDIGVSLTGGYVLMIEDKTNTGFHSRQLLRYKKDFAEKSRYEEQKQIRIYFKTGYQYSFANENKRGWAEFTRKDLLNFLENHKTIEHPIFQDFLKYQQKQEDCPRLKLIRKLEDEDFPNLKGKDLSDNEYVNISYLGWNNTYYWVKYYAPFSFSSECITPSIRLEIKPEQVKILCTIEISNEKIDVENIKRIRNELRNKIKEKHPYTGANDIASKLKRAYLFKEYEKKLNEVKLDDITKAFDKIDKIIKVL